MASAANDTFCSSGRFVVSERIDWATQIAYPVSMTIQRICIGPTPACVTSNSQFYSWVDPKAIKCSDGLHLAQRGYIEQCDAFATDLDQLVGLQFRDAIGHRLAIDAEHIGHLLVCVTGDFLAPAAQS